MNFLKTVRSKYLSLTLLLIIIGLGFPSYFLFNKFSDNFIDRSKVMINAGMNVVHGSINKCMNRSGEKDVQKLLFDFVENDYLTNVRIYTTENEILFSTNEEEIGMDISVVEPHHKNVSVPDIVFNEEKYIFSAHSEILNGPGCRDCHDKSQEIIAFIEFETHLTASEKKFLTGINHTLLLGIVILLSLFFLLYYFFNKLIGKPLLNTIGALNSVAEGNLDISLPEKRKDEFGKMNRHFNGMVNKLKDTKRKIEEFHLEQLQHADKLATLGELTAEIAHEINNPNGIILSRSDYLLMEAEEKSNFAEYISDLEVILKQSEKIKIVTSNILRYGRKLSQNFAPLKASEIIEQSISVLQPKIKGKKLIIEKNFLSEESMIFVDSIQLEQLIINLLGNAIDASDYNDKIILSLFEENNKLAITIEDYGIGMKENVREKIFSPFYTTKTEKKGTGLGLYIVKNICENLKADISCKSEYGKGTTFKVIFEKHSENL